MYRIRFLVERLVAQLAGLFTKPFILGLFSVWITVEVARAFIVFDDWIKCKMINKCYGGGRVVFGAVGAKQYISSDGEEKTLRLIESVYFTYNSSNWNWFKCCQVTSRHSEKKTPKKSSQNQTNTRIFEWKSAARWICLNWKKKPIMDLHGVQSKVS